MKTPDSARILEILKQLCAIASVSGRAEQENRCAQYIADFLNRLIPESEGRLSARLVPCEGDALGRNAVIALLRASRATDKTIILTGHFDVVDTAVCGELREQAFNPDAYTESLKGFAISQEAKKDLESGNWLFGRGTMDMKAGLALFLASMEQWIRDRDLAVNIIFWAVPDEEANSAGMIGSLRAFSDLCRSEHLKCVAALTGEPCFWTSETEMTEAVRPYYLGTTGKLMPFFYALGKPAHVGNYFEGLNAALMLSEIVTEAETDIKLFEGEGLDLLAPPTCLYMQVRRESYSVTLPEAAVAYFNVLTARKDVEDIMRWACLTAASGAAKTRRRIEEARLFALTKGADYPDCPQVNILQYKLLRKMAAAKCKERFEEELAGFWKSVPSDIDAREAAIKECEWLISKANPPRPAIIVGLLPPYYPARVNRSASEEERELRSRMEEVVAQAKEMSSDGAVRMHEVFGGISDLSFLGFKTLNEQALRAAPNMAGWGRVFHLPTDIDFSEEIPVANMGPAGRDAHQMTERLELDYSLNIAPKLLLELIRKLS